MTTYRFDVERYEKLFHAGILTNEDHIELLDGDLIVQSPIGSRHANVVNRLTELLAKNAGDRFFVSPQNPFRLDAHSMPQPDLALVHRRVLAEERYAFADDIFLAIEVADSSLRYDRTVKRGAYARNGIAEYWIFDLTRDLVLVHQQADPDAAAYTVCREVPAHDVLAPVAFPDLFLPLPALFGQARR
ncbi:MAG TPA: Uma2 family endonuclease [Chthoniobacterales bacterium]